MGDHSSENYLDQLLNSCMGEETNSEGTAGSKTGSER